MTKKSKIVTAIILAILTAGSGYFALIMYGLARMDSGVFTLTPQLLAIFALPVVLLLALLWVLVRKS